jgi:hypothetical protein
MSTTVISGQACEQSKSKTDTHSNSDDPPSKAPSIILQGTLLKEATKSRMKIVDFHPFFDCVLCSLTYVEKISKEIFGS